MRKIFAAILMIASEAIAQIPPDIRVLQEDARSVVLEFIPRVDLRNVRGVDGEDFVTVELAGGILDADARTVVRIRALPILLPSRQFSVQVLMAEYKDLDGVRVAPKPEIVPDKEFGFSLRYRSLPAEASSPGRRPPLAEVTEVRPLGEVVAGSLRIRPVEVLAEGKLRVYSRITVRVEFPAWKSRSLAASALLRGQIPAVFAAPTAPASSSPLATGDWYRMETPEPGIYKLDQNFFRQAGISLSALGNIQSIRIFGNGGRALPEDLNVSRPNGLEEVARLVVDMNANGQLDADDYVLFYGVPAQGWNYDPTARLFSHYIHPYATKNFYFVTFGGVTNGKPMDSVASLSTPGLVSQGDFLEKIFTEQERYNLTGSGRRWVGQSFSYFDNSAVYPNTLLGYQATKPVNYKYTVLSSSASVDTFRVTENDDLIGSPILMYPTAVGDDIGPAAYESPITYGVRVTPIPDGRSLLKFRFGTGNQAANAWLDWFELFYSRRYEASQDFLLFGSPDTSGVVQYTVRNLSSREVLVLDVSTHADVRKVTQVEFDPTDPSVCTFRLPQSAGSVRTIAVSGPNGYKTPANVKKISNSNLHGITGRVDFIIISPQEFLADANRLKTYREQRDSLKTIVVDVEQVYNEFSGGMQDPMAIRDFLKYAQANWASQRQYVLLFGAGHYDYKNISTSVRNWIPPYESVESISRINTFASDDYFVLLTPGDNHVSMAMSRIPARSVSEASAMVDKIIAYETTAPYDSWRNRITFVADDGLASPGQDDGSTHTFQAERLAQTFTPASFEQRKIYIVEYPTVSSSTGRRKPEANKAIVDAINRGTLIMNYTGHGNDKLWAHEYIFTKEENIPQLTNKSMQTFLVGATCNFGQYDNPNEQSAGELMLVMAQGGAVAEVTASRVVYSTDNAEFNYRLYSYLFQRDASDLPPRLGDAMWLTKQDLNSTNDLKFHLLGDPTMRLAMPRAVASVDSVNGSSTAQLSYMQSLGKVTVSGGVRRQNGSLWSTFNGTGLMELFDSKRQVVVPEWGNFTFDVNGSLLYRGEVSVNNGVFKAVFPIPKDVTFGNRSRISFYAAGDSTDAVGFTENVAIQGTDTSVVPDTTGPQVEIFLNDPAFRSGDVVKPDALLMVNLSDQGGINTSSAGIGHRLQATITNPDVTLDLTDYYRGNLDQYQSGQVQYPLTGLVEGHHELAVKAWDVFNNSAESRIVFNVRTNENFELLNVFNFPNPFSTQTTFTFERGSTDPVDVEIKIYTVAGRLVRILRQDGIGQRFVQIDWEGRDQDDNQVANGVYFYRVIARTQDRMSATETIGKLTVMR